MKEKFSDSWRSGKYNNSTLDPPAKVDTKIYVSFDSYEMLVSNVPHQMKEKIMIKSRFSSQFFNLKKKGEFGSNFWNTPSGGLKLNQKLVQCGTDPMIQSGLFSRCA